MQTYERLEKEYAKFAGTKYAVSVNSGTAALHLSLVALGIGPGDEVIVPDFTMAACAFAVSYTGAVPIFVDCDETLCINVVEIEEKISPRTKAIMPVHIYGRLANMEAINRLAAKHNLAVIEDACEAQGALIGPATMTCFSFYKNKIIHAEEGGIICTNDEKLYEEMKDLKSMAFGPEHNYFHKRIGFNYRMPNAQAELALKSLDEVEDNLMRRREIVEIYDNIIKPASSLGERDVPWVYDIFDLTLDKDKILHNVPEARHFFKPMTTMPMYSKNGGFTKAFIYSNAGFYLPVDPTMTDAQIISIAKRVIM